jgi:hypothetical protein
MLSQNKGNFVIFILWYFPFHVEYSYYYFYYLLCHDLIPNPCRTYALTCARTLLNIKPFCNYGKLLTRSQRYGTSIKAIPAGTLEEPTPRFLTTVGNSSAVNTGITALDEDTENLPAIANAMVTHSRSLLPTIQD